ncbi:hypothetical protein [Marinivivus vitaminiproducens]|uniref:hypothetical protein n=1 Tax=Marinivivus vitaminiproducens TaxID=3035935 RepID=UPI0027AAA1A2|nr:hypothetical protein P4R82_25025 [Geminicoccaceae bacterium SCSIO 64248]
MSRMTPDLSINLKLTRPELNALEDVAGDMTAPAWARRIVLQAVGDENARHELQVERQNEMMLEWLKAVYERLAALDHGKLVNTHIPREAVRPPSLLPVIVLLFAAFGCLGASVGLAVWDADSRAVIGLLALASVIGVGAFALYLKPPKTQPKRVRPKPRTVEQIDLAVKKASKEVEARAMALRKEMKVDTADSWGLAWAEVTFRTIVQHTHFVSAYAEQEALNRALVDREFVEDDIVRTVDRRLGVSRDVWHEVKWGGGDPKGETADREGRGR